MEQNANSPTVAAETASPNGTRRIESLIKRVHRLGENADGKRGVIWLNHTLKEYVCVPCSLMDKTSLERVARFLFRQTSWWSAADDIEAAIAFDSTGSSSRYLDYTPSAILSFYQDHKNRERAINRNTKPVPPVKEIRYVVQMLRDPPTEMGFTSRDSTIPQVIPLQGGLCLWRQCDSDSDE